MNKASWAKLPADVQQVMMDLKEEQAVWTGEYMDQQIKDAVAWSKEEQGVEVITLSAGEKPSGMKKLSLWWMTGLKMPRPKGSRPRRSSTTSRRSFNKGHALTECYRKS